MSNVPAELHYRKEHEWLRKEADGTYTVGITEHAQELLGDMVFVDLPEVGATVEAGADCAVAESVKAASDIYAPQRPVYRRLDLQDQSQRRSAGCRAAGCRRV